MHRRTFITAPTLIASLAIVSMSGSAEAATPTYYNDLMTFQADVTDTVTDDYANPGYVFNQNDGQMSAVVGETDYQATGHPNTNLVTGNQAYCAGCNGSFELSFTTTTVGDATGVNGVGLQVLSHDLTMQYFAYITFADGTTENVGVSGPGTFWGVSAPERIERIHFGLIDGGSTTNGYFEVDSLIVGDGFDETPCGDGIAQDDEECDDAGNSMTCDANCTLATCGDGTWNELAGEACDDAGASPTCNADCTAINCGDGQVNMAAGEICDDAGESATCDSDCTLPSCGDDVPNIAAGEECDDGSESPACDGDCTLVVCGDGIENNTAGEYCDDGNDVDGDGCSAICENEEISSTSDAESSSDGGGSEGGEESTESGGGNDTSGDASDTAVDSSGAVTTADTSGNTGGGTGDSSPATFGPGSDSTGDGETGGNSGGAMGTPDPVSGCSCTTDERGDWSMLGWLGLGALARRRRRVVTA